VGAATNANVIVIMVDTEEMAAVSKEQFRVDVLQEPLQPFALALAP
jgi:hypothetical protein